MSLGRPSYGVSDIGDRTNRRRNPLKRSIGKQAGIESPGLHRKEMHRNAAVEGLARYLSPAGFPIGSPLAVARYSARDRKNRRFHISTGFSDRISTRIHTYVSTTEITKVLNGTPYPRCDLSCVFCPSIGGRSDKFPSCHDVNLAWPPTAIWTTRTNAIISLFAHPYRHDEAN